MATISKEEQEAAAKRLRERGKAPAPALAESTETARERQLLKLITSTNDPIEKRKAQDELRTMRGK